MIDLKSLASVLIFVSFGFGGASALRWYTQRTGPAGFDKAEQILARTRAGDPNARYVVRTNSTLPLCFVLATIGLILLSIGGAEADGVSWQIVLMPIVAGLFSMILVKANGLRFAEVGHLDAQGMALSKPRPLTVRWADVDALAVSDRMEQMARSRRFIVDLRLQRGHETETVSFSSDLWNPAGELARVAQALHAAATGRG